MSSDQYVLAWMIYLIGVIGCMLVWFRMTSCIKNKRLSYFVRSFLFYFLLMPVYTHPDLRVMGPAFFIGVFDSLANGVESFFKTGSVLILVPVLAFITMIIFSFLLKKRSV